MKYNSVTVCPVRALEPGDLIALEFMGTVISGLVTGIAHRKSDLSPEQLQYMREEELDIPEEQFDTLGGRTSLLIFGSFQSGHSRLEKANHMYLDFDQNVAVFPNGKAQKKPGS